MGANEDAVSNFDGPLEPLEPENTAVGPTPPSVVDPLDPWGNPAGAASLASVQWDPEPNAAFGLPAKPPKQSISTYIIPTIKGKVLELGSPQELQSRKNHFINKITQLDNKEINKTPGAKEQLIKMSEKFTSVPIQIMEDFIQQWPKMMVNRRDKRSSIAEQILENEQISISQADDLARIAIPITGNADPVKIKEILESTKTEKEWKKYLVKWW